MRLINLFTYLCVMNLAVNSYAQEKEILKNECKIEDLNIETLFNGGKLFYKAEKKVNELIESEKAAGRTPKVFMIARAGQDLSGVVTLKDEFNGKLISLNDIFADINPSFYESQSGQPEISRVQYEIQRKYADPKRQLRYSHVGFLIIDHPANHETLVLEKANMSKEKLGWEKFEISGKPGDFWVEELLKPCITMRPRAWVTGLSLFFQDEPHEYASLIMVPVQGIQDRLLKLLFEDKMQKPFLGQKYNVAAPYSDLIEQNSASWVLDLVAAAQFYDVGNSKSRELAHRFLARQAFRPTKLLANSFITKMATSFLAPNSVNIKNSDHRYARPYNVLELVTELSVREYMLGNNLIVENGISEVQLAPEELYRNPNPRNNVR